MPLRILIGGCLYGRLNGGNPERCIQHAQDQEGSQAYNVDVPEKSWIFLKFGPRRADLDLSSISTLGQRKALRD